MDTFIHDIQAQLVGEAALLLPKGTRFFRYEKGGTFLFIQRRDSGKTILHHVEGTPLEVIRKGFNKDHFTQTEIVAKDPGDNQVRREPSFGLFGAPDGTYVSFITLGDSSSQYSDLGDGRTLASYGVVEKGKFRKILGTNWAGAKGFYSRWDEEPGNIVVKEGKIQIDPTKDTYTNCFYVGQETTDPDANTHTFATQINEYLEKSPHPWGRPRKPSPDYFDTSRWTYDEKDLSWSFK